MGNEQTPVTKALDSYAAAVYAKDADAFTAIYDENVHIYDSWGQWQYTGIDAWRSMAGEWFASLGDERVQVEFNDVQSVAGADVAFGHAAVTFAGISAEGERLRAMTNRFTICLEKKNDAWKIAHEHSSLPIDMETGKGIFTS